MQQTPNEIAVIYGNDKITYKDLNNKANILAHRLIDLGIGPEVIVGICSQPSIKFIIGVLAILKAGGAYVPIDIDGPKSYIKTIIKNTKAKIVLTCHKENNNLFAKLNVSLITIDSLTNGNKKNPNSAVNKNNLAYIIYTSGSTGKPKGVAITHEGIYDRTLWKIKNISLNEKSSFLQLLSFLFDASFLVCFWSLCGGSKLVLAPKKDILNIDKLINLIIQHKITCISIFPTLLNVLLDNSKLEKKKLPLTHVVSGGELLTKAIVNKFYNSLNAVLYNAYGPTEASVYASLYLCDKKHKEMKIPIGRSAGGAKLYVLDKNMQVVPVGVVGELYIGGIGVARGYVNRPELTKEKFVDNPFKNDPSEKLYRTGDLVKYLPDGNLLFLGRSDNQVKINGYRIELGEIESALGNIDNVEMAIVTTRGKEQVQLIAYVKTKKRRPQEKLRNYLLEKLQEKLPSYMIPKFFIAVKEFPKLPNGKINFKALPDVIDCQFKKKMALPSNDTEIILINIWQELLSVKQICINDNFFDVGGNSLLTIQLVSQIKKNVGVEFPLSDLFRSPTIKDIANIINKRQFNAWSCVVPINTNGSGLPFFCVHPIGGNVFCFRELANHFDDQPFYGLQARGLEKGQKPHSSIKKMAAEYIEAIKQVQPKGPYFLGGWSFGGIVAAEMAHQLLEQGERVLQLVLLDTTACFKDILEFDEEENLRAVLSQNLEISKKDQDVSKELLFNLLNRTIKQDDYVKRLRRLIKKNYQALRKFKLRSIDCQTLLIRSNDSRFRKKDNDLGWGKYTQSLEVRQVQGDHWMMIQEPFVKDLVAHLQQYQPILLRKK